MNNSTGALSQFSGVLTALVPLAELQWKWRDSTGFHTHRIHGAAIYGNMDPIHIPPMLAYIPALWIRHGIVDVSMGLLDFIFRDFWIWKNVTRNLFHMDIMLG